MKKLDNLPGFQELSAQEKVKINGGESFWYVPVNLFGRALRFIQGALENPPNPQSATTYK